MADVLLMDDDLQGALQALEHRGERVALEAGLCGVVGAQSGLVVGRGEGRDVGLLDLLDLVTGQDVPDDIFEYEPPPGTAGR